MSLMDAFHVNTATRSVILSQSLNKNDGPNKIVRQSLGFRELKDGRGKPVFASKEVAALHSALDTLAQTLPYHDLEELRSEWKSGNLLQDDLDLLLNKHGRRIWGIPVAERDCLNNLEMPLLRAGDNKFYEADLMLGDNSHRK